jgi:two-component system LytT family sensor kinase
MRRPVHHCGVTDAMPAPRSRSRTLLRAAAVVAAWTLFGLLWSASSFWERGGRESFLERADHIVPFYWAWALMTPPLYRAARHLVRRTGPGRRAWLALAALSPAVVLAHCWLYTALIRLLGVEPRVGFGLERIADYTLRHGGGDVATWLALAGAWLLVDAERRARDREVHAAALEARLARADLELLRWRLQPHFLFNALNTVSTMVLRGDAAAAVRAIELMARWLRGALRDAPEATVPLSAEIDAVRRYLDIEALRFGEALRLATAVEPGLLDVPVPGTILQPLVENAVRHAAAVREGRGPITISASRDGGQVRLTVADPGGAAAAGAESAPGTGFGLRYVRERLRLRYGDRARLELHVAPGGSVATIELPAPA